MSDTTMFEIIMYAGNSKSCSMEAIELARQGDIDNADEKMSEAYDALIRAQTIHSKWLKKSQKISDINPNMLCVHAQDHLSAAKTHFDLASEIVNLHEQIREIKTYLGIENFKTQKNIRILLVCGQGMSTSLLVQNMYRYADEGDYIESSSFEELSNVVSDYDVILVSPQIRYRIPVIERMISPRRQIVGLMEMKAYGKLDGLSLYNFAKEIFKKIKR